MLQAPVRWLRSGKQTVLNQWEAQMLKRTFALVGLSLAMVSSIVSLSMAQEDQPADGSIMDIGKMDKSTAYRVFSSKPNYSPYAGRKYPTRPLFGDTHLHTAASFDAGAFGARLGARDAYRFARGEEVTSSSGQPAKLSRPLDFLVVADHSDNMGMFPDLFAGKPELLADPTGKKWYEMIKGGKGDEAALEIIGAFGAGKMPKPLTYAPGILQRGDQEGWRLLPFGRTGKVTAHRNALGITRHRRAAGLGIGLLKIPAAEKPHHHP